METNKWLAVMVSLLLVFGLVNMYGLYANKNISKDEVKTIVGDEIAKITIPEPIVPTAEEIASKMEYPKVEDADNALLNDFLEEYFGEDYSDLEDHAIEVAFDEMEHHDFEVVVDYLKTLLSEGQELDEGSIEIGGEDLDEVNMNDLEDVDVEVIALGLKEDDDKSATVTFELKTRYELEEGVDDVFKDKIVVVYNVVFDEGDWNDEEVELVSIA